MAENTLFSELVSLVNTSLLLNCPVLSGNMKANVQIEDIESNFARISISAPSYDISKWKKTGIIEHDGKYDYAISVNEVGAFGGKSTKSKHWVNKTIVNACRIIGSLYNAEVVVNVDL